MFQGSKSILVNDLADSRLYIEAVLHEEEKFMKRIKKSTKERKFSSLFLSHSKNITHFVNQVMYVRVENQGKKCVIIIHASQKDWMMKNGMEREKDQLSWKTGWQKWPCDILIKSVCSDWLFHNATKICLCVI